MIQTLNNILIFGTQILGFASVLLLLKIINDKKVDGEKAAEIANAIRTDAFHF